MASPQVWFITGSSSGFGRAMAEAVLNNGGIVVATLRKPEALSDMAADYPADRLLILRLDVTDIEEIGTAFRKAKDVFGRIDVVFNNAGVALAGEVESTPHDVARAVFEVLFWGAANVTREAMGYFRANKPIGGRLLQISSDYGVLSEAGTGYYSAAKFGKFTGTLLLEAYSPGHWLKALEGLTEALVKEIDPEWNIKITLCEPGPFVTNIGINASVVEAAHPAYPPLQNGKHRCDPLNLDVNGDKDKAAEAFLKLSSMPNPPLRLPLHKVAIDATRTKAAALLSDAEKFESWSEDMYLPAERIV